MLSPSPFGDNFYRYLDKLYRMVFCFGLLKWDELVTLFLFQNQLVLDFSSV
jgi:hypothetical protein